MSALVKRTTQKIEPTMLIVIALLLVLVVVGSIANRRFRTPQNFTNVLEQSAALGFVSLGQNLVILTGGIDLSIGSMINLTSSLTSGIIDGEPSRVAPVVVGVLLLGLAVGTLNGLLIVGLRIHPLIITLGMSSILQGATLIYTLMPPGKVPRSFENFAFGRVLGIPYGTLIMVALFVLVWLILKKFRLGRYIYAVGGNREGARLSGISNERVLVFVYAMCGFFAALTGVYLVSRLGIGDPRAGQGYELASITPVVIGGTILAGGKGGVWGTLLGVLLISVLNNLLNFLGLSAFYQWIVQGVIIIIAVAVYLERRQT
jgi:ribose transport system permease protein